MVRFSFHAEFFFHLCVRLHHVQSVGVRRQKWLFGDAVITAFSPIRESSALAEVLQGGENT